MTYATLAQLEKRFGKQLLVQLTDRAEAATGAIDVSIVDQELANTDAVIDGYLAGRYRLPLESIPPLLADIALMIAIYKLHAFSPEEKIAKDYEAAMRSLREIGTGAMRLPVAGAEPASSGSGGVQVVDRDRPLTPESLKGFI